MVEEISPQLRAKPSLKKSRIKALPLDKLRIHEARNYFDEAEVETLVSRYHPLGEKKLKGRRISYTVQYRGEIVAVLQFDEAVYRNRLREECIGWDRSLIKSRVKHVANNCRFLVMPAYAGEKNLASKCLSLASARISNDFKKHYGVPLLALETYVDSSNEGSCYKAAGWHYLGDSAGFLQSNGERTSSKHYYLKALHEESFSALRSIVPHALLTGVKNVSGESNNNFVLDSTKIDIRDLQQSLRSITDPRRGQGKVYEFVPFLTLCICAVFSGYTQYRQITDWISKRPREELVKFGFGGDRIPSESAVTKFLRNIDPVELQTVLNNWVMRNYGKKSFKVVAIDGKSLRATGKNNASQQGFLNVYAVELGIVLDQVPVLKGGAERIAARTVIGKDDNLSEKIIIADAIQTDNFFLKKSKKRNPRLSSLSKAILRL